MKKILTVITLLTLNVFGQELSCNSPRIEHELSKIYEDCIYLGQAKLVVLYKHSVICTAVIDNGNICKVINYEVDYKNNDIKVKIKD